MAAASFFFFAKNGKDTANSRNSFKNNYKKLLSNYKILYVFIKLIDV